MHTVCQDCQCESHVDVVLFCISYSKMFQNESTISEERISLRIGKDFISTFIKGLTSKKDWKKEEYNTLFARPPPGLNDGPFEVSVA